MKTIKCERQVRLEELIKYIFDNDIRDDYFENESCGVEVASNGDISSEGWIDKNDLFTITEEVEITEETPLQRAMVIKDNCNAQAIYECIDAEEITNGILKYIDLLEDNNA